MTASLAPRPAKPQSTAAQRCGLAGLAGEHVRIASPAGVNPGLKIGCLVAGMAAMYPVTKISPPPKTGCSHHLARVRSPMAE